MKIIFPHQSFNSSSSIKFTRKFKKMGLSSFPFLLAVVLLATKADATHCGKGWTAFKDEQCLKSFNKLLTYDEAKEYCSSQENSSLVMVKESDMHAFLANFTQHHYDNLWLGGKYDEGAGDFRWDDGTPLTFTNWQEGYQRNASLSGTCIELRTGDDMLTNNTERHWAYVRCKRRNLVMCQKSLEWSLQDAIGEIKKMRKQLEDARDERVKLDKTQEFLKIRQQLQEAKNERSNLTKKLELVSSRVVPVGSIYIEYNNQPSPKALWPDLKWTDVTSSYAGLFFRASGGGAENWGSVQNECAPRITQAHHTSRTGSPYPNPINIPANGWSEFGRLGSTSSVNSWHEALRFHTQGCEIRPKNQAIRMWKRTG